MDPDFWRKILADGAENLARRLQSGEIERTHRGPLRALLVRAFDALDKNEMNVELAREVDAAVALKVQIPAPVRLTGPRMMGNVDEEFVERLWAPEMLVDILLGRLQRFLACIKREDVRRFLRTPTEGSGPEIDFEYTEG